MRQARGDDAHRVHALLVQAHLAVAQPLRVAAHLFGHVVRQHHHDRAGRSADPFEAQLGRLATALEATRARALAAAQ